MTAIPATDSRPQAFRPLSVAEGFDISRSREVALSRLLTTYILTGLGFMLLPGTFLGVWNLFRISAHHAGASVSPAWVQAHGHAQIFGWVGTFILGIGFYSIPKLRRSNLFGLQFGWLCWGLWTGGVALRWFSNIYQWHWRWFLPVSAALELCAYLIFSRTVSGHHRQDSSKARFEEWIFVVMAASAGFLMSLVVNLGFTIYVALSSASPAFPATLDQRYLVLSTWGFLVPFVWGFSAKWLPVFLGLRPLRPRWLLAAVVANVAGVLAALIGLTATSALTLLGAIMISVPALRLCEPTQQAAKVKGVHSSFPIFVRAAYVWAIVAAGLGVWAVFMGNAAGIWGASRHALTVGFLATMVFCIGQRVLPAFSGMRLLFSTKLMFLDLLLLTAGCALRVSSEIVAYQGYGGWAWSWLSVSAICEMTAVTLFAINLLATFASRPCGPGTV